MNYRYNVESPNLRFKDNGNVNVKFKPWQKRLTYQLLEEAAQLMDDIQRALYYPQNSCHEALHPATTFYLFAAAARHKSRTRHYLRARHDSLSLHDLTGSIQMLPGASTTISILVPL